MYDNNTSSTTSISVAEVYILNECNFPAEGLSVPKDIGKKKCSRGYETNRTNKNSHPNQSNVRNLD
jgi:hypothetical protein